MLDLEVDVLVSLSGASSAEVSVNDSIEASLSGASSLRYRGDPDVITLDVSGASSIGQITDPGLISTPSRGSRPLGIGSVQSTGGSYLCVLWRQRPG
jgi:hypothetical protein